MTKIKSVVDIASEATSAVGWTDSYSAIFHAEKVIREDRLSHKEAIVGDLEKEKKQEIHACVGTNCPQFCVNVEHNQAIDQAIAIVNSIYKDNE